MSERPNQGASDVNRLLCHLRRAALLSASGPSDAQLLDAFLNRHDEAAFEALVRRHGPMVHSVCRRVVGNIHDADDAFQATFIVLVRKAGTLRSRPLLAGWLYGVACRNARKARAMSQKRRAKEKHAAEQPRPEASTNGVPEELLARLDEELNRLPERYRLPVVLCELQGHSRKQAAQTLNGDFSDRKKLIDALRAPLKTPFGDIKFDQCGNAIRSIFLKEIKPTGTSMVKDFPDSSIPCPQPAEWKG